MTPSINKITATRSLAISIGSNPVFSEEDYLWAIQEEQEISDLRVGYAKFPPQLHEEAYSVY